MISSRVNKSFDVAHYPKLIIFSSVPMYPKYTRTEESDFELGQRKLWSSSAESDLIDILKLHPELWDPSNPNFRKNSIKTKLFKKIADTLRDCYPQFARDIDYHSVHKKLNILKSYYWKEIKKSKIRQSYVSSWEHFTRLSFLGHTQHKLMWKKEKRKRNSEKIPTIVKLPITLKKNDSVLKMSSNLSSDPDSSINIKEIYSVQPTTDTPSSLLNTENTDEAFGQYIMCLLKSMPESKKKDDVRMKIIQDLIKCKNS